MGKHDRHRQKEDPADKKETVEQIQDGKRKESNKVRDMAKKSNHPS